MLRTSSDNLVYGAADRHHEDDIQEHSGGGSDEEEDDCENVRGEEGKDEELLPGAAAYVIGSEDDGDEQHDSASFIGEITQDHHCYAKNLMSCLKHSSDSLLYGNGNGGGGGGGGEVNAKQTGEGVGYARELVSCLRQSSDGKIYEEWSAEHAHQVKEEVEDHVNEALDCVAEKMYMYHISTKILPRKGGRMASTNPSESGMSEYHDAESGRSRNSVAGGSSRGSISVASAGSSVYMDTNA